MNISINNFKSLSEIKDFELKPFTILSGTNSSGKSSFIQLLLILKQTIELDSSKKPILLDGYLYQVQDYKDILTQKSLKNKLEVTLKFDKSDISVVPDEKRLRLFDSYPDYNCTVKVIFGQEKFQEFVEEFSVQYNLPEGEKREQYIKFLTTYKNGKKCRIETNNELFGKDLWIDPPKINEIAFSGFYPAYYETISVKEGESARGEKTVASNVERKFPYIEEIKTLIDSIFKSISYIGPLREQPKDEYSIAGNHAYVGPRGEYVAQILQTYEKEKILLNKFQESEDGFATYSDEKADLITGVRYWMCEVFGIAKDIYSKKTDDSYKIILKNDNGLETSIKHVGFGISQILPIIVEGLLLQKGGTIVLEQPEIHLHPKVQSLLFDFLYGLVRQGKNVIIETHSDHFITRMRRRVAEDLKSNLPTIVNLTFIETEKSKVLFRSITMDDLGTLSYFPMDFIEQSGVELRAIVKAQMKKRLAKK